MAVEAAPAPAPPATTTPAAPRRVRSVFPYVRAALVYLALFVCAGIILLPLYLTVVDALLKTEELISAPPKLFPPHPQWHNFKDAWETGRLQRYMVNSFVVSAIITVGQVITSAMAAYAFAFVQFPGRRLLFFVFLSTLMVPWEVTVIPNFQTIEAWGWIDTYQALTVPFLATAFGTFLLRQYFMTIPRELRDAAAIDGYGHIAFLWHVVLPLARPVIAALAVFSFLQAWNQYLWPLLVTNSDNLRTVQIGLSALDSQNIDSFNLVFAGTVLAEVPMLITLVLFQGHLIRGLTAGAIKG